MPRYSMMVSSHLVFLSAVCVCISTASGVQDTVTVNTPQGRIRGISVPVIGHENETVYQFRKIPFASPPIGDLRFAKPVPYPVWNDTLDGTEFGPLCMQPIDEYSKYLLPNQNVSEDCLFLNIYVPSQVDPTTKRSVMVWIHGGGYFTGTGIMYEGSYLALAGDVIVVTINYRLNIFGFFTTGDSNAKGNYGLWDQILALQWVHDNIGSFGGDPNSVTIFGESAGGFSVSLQSLIPSNRGLFQRVIAESGVANSRLATSPTASYVTRGIGISANCTQNMEDPAFLSCMRGLDSQSVMNAMGAAFAKTVPDAIHLAIVLGPVVDSELLSDDPSNILANSSSEGAKFFKSLDFIIGNCDTEGSLVLISTTPQLQKLFNFNLSTGFPTEVFKDYIVNALSHDYLKSSSKASTAICNEYCVKNNISEQSRQVLNMHGDFFFIAPAVASLNYHTIGNTQTKRYQYIFSRRSPAPYGPKRPAWYTGSGHASEIIYLFGMEKVHAFLHTYIPEADYKLSHQMLKYWTNFAKSGDPNGGSDLPVWQPYVEPVRSYLRLDEQVVSDTNYEDRRVHFWLAEIPTLIPNGSIQLPEMSPGAASGNGVRITVVVTLAIVSAVYITYIFL